MELPESWQRVFALAERWGYPLTSSDGCSEEELDDQDISLPPLVRLWYQYVGRCERLYHSGSQLHLTPVNQLEIASFADDAAEEDLAGDLDEYPRRLTIYDENQYVYSWVILESGLALPDPPVYIEDVDRVLSEDQMLIPSASHFSDFAAQAFAFELIFQSDSEYSLERPAQPFAQIASSLTAVANGPLVYAYPNTMEFWYSDTVLIATENGEWFDGIALTEQARADFESRFSPT
jgi:hypothetical protein